jgi:hypothetical protein
MSESKDSKASRSEMKTVACRGGLAPHPSLTYGLDASVQLFTVDKYHF